MLTSSLLITLSLASALQMIHVAAASDAVLSWTIYHSWNAGQEFVRRGSLTWGAKEAGSEEKSFQIHNDESSNLTGKDIQDMLNYGWYHVKIQGEGEDSFVFQTVPACNLRRANFKDQFDVTLPRTSLGDKQDPMTSFAYTPLVSPLAPKTCGDYEDEEDTTKSFSSRVSVQLDTPGMTIKSVLPQSKPPPGVAFIKKTATAGGSQTQQDGDYGEDDEPPSPVPSPMGFFSKYWYIILPMLILQVLQAPEEQPPQSGGQPQQPQQGGNQVAGGSPQKARRGKTSRK